MATMTMPEGKILVQRLQEPEPAGTAPDTQPDAEPSGTAPEPEPQAGDTNEPEAGAENDTPPDYSGDMGDDDTPDDGSDNQGTATAQPADTDNATAGETGDAAPGTQPPDVSAGGDNSATASTTTTAGDDQGAAVDDTQGGDAGDADTPPDYSGDTGEDDDPDAGGDDTGDEDGEEPPDYSDDVGDEGGEGEDDTGDDDAGDTGGGSSSGDVDPELGDAEKDIFSDLTASQMAVKAKELKSQFVVLHSDLVSILDRITSVSRTKENIRTIEFITRKCMELKDMVRDALVYTFEQKTYTQNKIDLERFIGIYAAIIRVIEGMNTDKNKEIKKLEESCITDFKSHFPIHSNALISTATQGVL